MSTACVEGKCIDPLTGNEVNYGGFISTVQCTDEAICGCPSSCGKNAWCVAGRCYSKLFSVIYQDIRLLYNPFGMLYRAIKGDLDDRIYEQYKSDELNDYKFSEVSFDIMEKMKNGYGYTDYFAHHIECCDGDYDYTESDLRCVRSMGCPCGSTTCGMGGLCEDGKCIYDSHYLNMMCYPRYSVDHVNDFEYLPDEDYNAGYEYDDLDMPASRSLRLDDAGNCLCNKTMLAPELLNNHREQYVCDDYGWVCTEQKGCACGDAICDYKALCLKPGLCTAPLEKYRGIAWSEDSREPLECASGVVDAKNQCCESGALDKTNKCCERGVLSASGYCCPSQAVSLDGQCACVVDVSGACCKSSVLNKDGNCCPEEFVTDTGQCMSDNDRSGKHVTDSPQLCEYGDTEKKQGILDGHGNCCKGILLNNECCASGVLDRHGDCCSSGVLNGDGGCCSSGALNRYGHCCYSEGVDKYGDCCPSGVDKYGKCCLYGVESGVCKCKSGVRHSSGHCCPEEFVDNSNNDKKCTCAVMDKEGDCCESGVLSKTGYCCPTDDVNPKNGTCRHSIDRYGDKHRLSSVFTNDGDYCESGILINDGEKCCQKEDVQNGRCLCSVYSGSKCCKNGIKDKKGYCCPTGVLSENGICCPKRHVGSNGQCLCLINSQDKCDEFVLDSSCVSGVWGVNHRCCRYGSKDKFGNCCDEYGVSNGYCLGYD